MSRPLPPIRPICPIRPIPSPRAETNARRAVIACLALCATGAIAGEADPPQLTYPVEGLPFQDYSNVCHSVVRQLPQHASLLMLHVYTTDSILVATTAEPATGQTNKVLHVFTNDASGWKHTRSHPKGQSHLPGLSAEDIQTLLLLAGPHLQPQDRILVLRRESQDKVVIMTGGLGAPFAGAGDALLFSLVDGHWVFKTKGRWKS